MTSREWRVLSGVATPEDRQRRLAVLARYRSRQSLFRFLMAWPGIRRVLMRPIEEEARRRVLDLLKTVRRPEPHKVLQEFPDGLRGGVPQAALIALALDRDPGVK